MLAALFIVVSALLSQRPNKVIGHEAHLGGALAGGAAAAIMYPQLWDRFLTVVAASLGGGA